MALALDLGFNLGSNYLLLSTLGDSKVKPTRGVAVKSLYIVCLLLTVILIYFIKRFSVPFWAEGGEIEK